MKEEHGENGTSKFGMVIDLDLCTGCGSCMVACMAENNVPFREDETDKLKSITWMRVYKLTNGKPYPETDICYLPRPCQHCEGHHGHSPCVSVCPATATDYDMQTGSSARSTRGVSDAGTAWPPAPTTPGISTGMIRFGRKAWKNT